MFYELLTQFVLRELGLTWDLWEHSKQHYLQMGNPKATQIFNLSLLAKRLQEGAKLKKLPLDDGGDLGKFFDTCRQILNFYMIYKGHMKCDKQFLLGDKNKMICADLYVVSDTLKKIIANCPIKDAKIDERKIKTLFGDNLFSDIIKLRYGIESAQINTYFDIAYNAAECPSDLKNRLSSIALSN